VRMRIAPTTAPLLVPRSAFSFRVIPHLQSAEAPPPGRGTNSWRPSDRRELSLDELTRQLGGALVFYRSRLTAGRPNRPSMCRTQTAGAMMLKVEFLINGSPMMLRRATVVAMLLIAACSGLTNTPDPNVVHVANLGYDDTACGPTTCDGKAGFQLLNSANEGRMGVVLVTSHGPTPQTVGVNARPDGWGWAPLTIDRATRPYEITACPEGVPWGNSRCATTSSR
jgi:hypothetical protein